MCPTPLQKYQNFLDSLVPHKVPRWIASVVLLCIYTIRVFVLQGWYIISYALAIYLLNLFIAFISPKFDPVMEEEEEIGETSNFIGFSREIIIGTIVVASDDVYVHPVASHRCGRC